MHWQRHMCNSPSSTSYLFYFHCFYFPRLSICYILFHLFIVILLSSTWYLSHIPVSTRFAFVPYFVCVCINCAQKAVTSWISLCLSVDSYRMFLSMYVCLLTEWMFLYSWRAWQDGCGTRCSIRPLSLRPCLCWGSKWLLSHVSALTVTCCHHISKATFSG